MGAGVAAAHVVIFIALASAGTLLVGSATDAVRENTQASAQAVDRAQAAANERLLVANATFLTNRCTTDNNPSNPGCQGGSPLPDRLYVNITNNGSEEVLLEDVTVLLDGSWTDPATLDVYRVWQAPTSNIWMPGETLQIGLDGSNPDVTVFGPHGAAAYRRA